MTLTEIAGPITDIHLVGRLDVAGAEAVGLRFTAAVTTPGLGAVVDLSEVSFIASMGMRMLVSAARALHQKERKLVLYGANDLVNEALSDAALDQILPCVATRDDAIACFSR